MPDEWTWHQASTNPRSKVHAFLDKGKVPQAVCGRQFSPLNLSPARPRQDKCLHCKKWMAEQHA